MRQAIFLGFLFAQQDGHAFMPAALTSRAIAGPSPLASATNTRSSRVGGSSLQMTLQQTPPTESAEGQVADEELLSVIELAGRKAAAAGFLPVLAAKAKEEQDIMWKLKVSPEDALAFADRAIDTAEDIFMHATRAFMPAAKMNLPLSSDDSVEQEPLTASNKERIVVLGTGWGGHAISKVIDSDKYEVIYVSPRNYFVFTPMLAAASVGTVDIRSITEPIRMANPCVKYVSGEVVEVVPGEKKVVVALPSPQEKRPPQLLQSAVAHVPPLRYPKEHPEQAVTVGPRHHHQQQVNSDEARPLMELSYDKLVYAVGAKTGTFGVPGVREHCYMLKEAQDARLLRAAIVNILEEACLPGVTNDEKRRLLSFVVIGAGPTGIEFTGELTDLIGNDVPRLFPDVTGLINLTVVSAENVLLPMFEEVLQNRGLSVLKSQGIKVLLGNVATEVTKDEVILKNGNRIPYGLCFWAGGTEPRPLTKQLVETIGPEQTETEGGKRGQIAVDGYMRALGTNGTILAVGDASSVQGVRMPTTGQVAAQEGAYVARLLNRGYNTSVEAAPAMTGYDGSMGMMARAMDFLRLRGRLEASPFHFINLGVLAYIGMGQAVAEVKVGKNTPVLDAAGKAGFFLWRSTYVVKQVSSRNRINVAVDWLKVRFFGRDITRL